MNNEKNKNNLIHISDILPRILPKDRPAKDTGMTQIWKIWDSAVGAPIAMNAKPEAFKGGILSVNVFSSAWIHQLKFLEKEMIANINTRLSTPLIKQIRFKIAKIHS